MHEPFDDHPVFPLILTVRALFCRGIDERANSAYECPAYNGLPMPRLWNIVFEGQEDEHGERCSESVLIDVDANRPVKVALWTCASGEREDSLIYRRISVESLGDLGDLVFHGVTIEQVEPVVFGV